MMSQKSYVEKLGLIPHSKVLKAAFPNFTEIVASSILAKVILYYGAFVERLDHPGNVLYAADYPAMSRTVHAALKLDPYNMDGYYFGQAILAWDAKQYQLASELLEYGMQYRTWDWQLPFFAGFNYAYFLGDMENAAAMYMRAGELSRAPLFKSLAGRYLQEAGRTQMAIDYLQTLADNAQNRSIKKSIEIRIKAFQMVLMIEQARDLYTEENGEAPSKVEELIADGYLQAIPVDPYGGKFFLDRNGQVRTTSKFSNRSPQRLNYEGS
jgi:tetratricopeptide (TPR) repeat protein